MQLAEVKEIIECLPSSKTRFYYFRDRYALLLLSLYLDGEVSKKELKQSRFGKLLEKDIVREAMQRSRSNKISANTFDSFWPRRYECYFLTLGVWGSKRGWSWKQTSRPGYNLVLQLNFSSAHDEPYRRLIDPESEHPFSYYTHPISGNMNTLAWARLDIDLERGEALIEEIQTDWIRGALYARRRAVQADDTIWAYGVEMQKDRVIRYVDSTLRRHEETWDEAMLSAAVWFLRRELGIKRIYYHTYESGARIKNISFRLPPRSIYSRLPKRFCFRATETRPGFLPGKSRPARASKRYDNARFSLLEL